MTPPPLSRDALLWLANVGLCYIPGKAHDGVVIPEAESVRQWSKQRWDAAVTEATARLRAALTETKE